MTTKTLLPVGRTFLQKFANRGQLRAVVVAANASPADNSEVLRVVFLDGTGRTKDWPLSFVSNNTVEGCCALVTDRLIVSSRNSRTGPDYSKTVITEFLLPSDPFASAPIFVNQISYGDRDSRQSELLALGTGEVVSMTAQQIGLQMRGMLRLGNGAWIDQGLFTLPGNFAASNFFSMCAEPWTQNGFWAYEVQDGGKGVSAGIFAAEGGKLVLKTGIFPFIKQGAQPSEGPWLVNGELPYLVATADAKRGRMIISYTNTEYPPPPPQQMAYPVCMEIKEDRIPVGLIRCAEAVPSILNPCPVIVTDSGVALDYRAGSHADTLVDGTNRMPTKNGQVAWNQYAHEFIYAQVDGALVLATTVAPPVPIPIPPPMANLVESPLSDLSWSGADPTNAGLFMLQSAPSKDGPWSNVTNRWNVQVQNLNPKQQTGEVLKVGNTFYRLTPKV